jgi:hypothetical protein
MEYSIQSGAKAVIYHYFEFHTVGKVSRVPFADYIVKIPIVMVSTSYVQQVLIPLLESHPFVTVEVTPGKYIKVFICTIEDENCFLFIDIITPNLCRSEYLACEYLRDNMVHYTEFPIFIELHLSAIVHFVQAMEEKKLEHKYGISRDSSSVLRL